LYNFEKAAGIRDSLGVVEAPASSSRTLTFGSSVSRAARTHPADPAPTIM
jgi:hypothetical protein